MGAKSVTAVIATHQGKQQARRLWFLYEWLTGERLSLEDISAGVRYLPILDPEKYFTGPQRQSPRHKITNNLLGDREFCPVVRKTDVLQTFIKAALSIQVEQVMGRTSQEVWRRAASFLLLADSRASFAVEGERPARNRIERWALVIQQAGRQPLSLSPKSLKCMANSSRTTVLLPRGFALKESFWVNAIVMASRFQSSSVHGHRISPL